MNKVVYFSTMLQDIDWSAVKYAKLDSASRGKSILNIKINY